MLDLLACGCAWSSRGIEWDDIVRVFGFIPLLLWQLFLDSLHLMAPVFIVASVPFIVWGVVALLARTKKKPMARRRRVVVKARRSMSAFSE